MKTKEYMTPEMEVVELKYQSSLLAGSNESIDDNTEGGSGDGGVDNPIKW